MKDQKAKEYSNLKVKLTIVNFVFTAIILDRISQGFAKKPKTVRMAG